MASDVTHATTAGSQACGHLPAEHGDFVREISDRVGSKWSLLVIDHPGRANDRETLVEWSTCAQVHRFAAVNTLASSTSTDIRTCAPPASNLVSLFGQCIWGLTSRATPTPRTKLSLTLPLGDDLLPRTGHPAAGPDVA